MTRHAFPTSVVGLALVASASWIAHATTTSPAPAAVSIPFERVNRHIVLNVSVNQSRPLPFVLDTGAKQAILKLERAKELRLKLHGEVRGGGGGAGRVTGSFLRNVTLALPGLPGFSQPLPLTLPLANLAPTHGQDIDGIIGGDFIKEFVVEIDYQARQITLHDKATFTYTGPGESLPIQFNSDGHPILQAEVTPLGGQPMIGTFLLDTGSALALALHSPFVDRHQLLGPDLNTIRAIGLAGAGGEMAGRIGRVAQLKIGTFRIDRPLTLFSQDRAGAFANPSLAGNIGGQLASRFRMFLDYGRSRVILEPSRTFADPFDRAFAGFSVRGEGQGYRTFRITHVLESSPASEAGLQLDDVITTIDGKPADQLKLTDVIELFELPATYAITIRRGTQVLKMTLTPRKLV